MPATDDRWDVVVVGLRDPSQATTLIVVAELAHYASLPSAQVERALAEGGELEVLNNLDRAEAERAAQDLSDLGAIVDLRLAPGTSVVFPVLKPDSERTVGVAVGGLIDDSATPPSMVEGRGALLPEVEPDLESVRNLRVPRDPMFDDDLVPPRTARRDPASSRRAVPTTLEPDDDDDPLDRLPMGDSGSRPLMHRPGIGEELPVPPPRGHAPQARATGVGPGSYPMHRDAADLLGHLGGVPRPISTPGVARPISAPGGARPISAPGGARPVSSPGRHRTPEPLARPRHDTGRALGDIGASLDALGPSSLGDIESSSLGGIGMPSLDDIGPSSLGDVGEPALGDLGAPPSRVVTPPRAAARPQTPKPAAASGAAAARPITPSGAGAARSTPTPAATPAPKPASTPASTPGPAKSPGDSLELDFEAVGLAKPVHKGGVPQGQPAAKADAPEPRRTRHGHAGGTGESAAGRSGGPASLGELLRTDWIATSLLAVAGMLIVSLLVALQIQRSSARDDLPPLEEELAASLNDPAGVEAGTRRAPAAIEGEIDDKLDGMERSFFIWWLALGVPVGLVIARLRAS